MTFNYLHSFVRFVLAFSLALNVYAQDTLSVLQTGACKDGVSQTKAYTNGKFMGWQKQDGTQDGITSPATSLTLVKSNTTTTYIAAARFEGNNMVTNGDFEADTVGLLSEYKYASRTDKQGDYTITTNPNVGRSTPVYALIGDHTSGTGKMLVADGDTNFKAAFMAKVPVTKGKEYVFSAWMANIHKKLIGSNIDTSVNKMPRLQFSIDNEVIGVYNFSNDSLWHLFASNWVASKTDTVNLKIVDLQSALKANDFALDDINFHSVTTQQASVTVEACATNRLPVFSPDGDGVLDTYYIEDAGTAKIYNLDGALIRELSVPAHWDGFKNNGALADAGYYAIVVNNNKSYRVSLVR